VVTNVKKTKVRLLTKTLAVVSLLVPSSGHSLGIGEIKLHSALNQNLDAEISLTLSGENASDIKVNLAPPEKFDEAGVSWNYFLSKIKFETIIRANGSALIKLTSKEVLKEPFLDFLLEVSWPKGNLYREFTVLVDPPSVYNPSAIPPASTNTENYQQPSAISAQNQTTTNGQTVGDEYGPTTRNDTLWGIAERASEQNDASVEQMMIAIYEANPRAFYQGNVHALTAGKILKIPEAAEALKLSRSQALAEFDRQTKAWKDHSATVQAETAKKIPVPSKAEEPANNQLTLIAPTQSTVSDDAVLAPVDEQANNENKTANESVGIKGNAVETPTGSVPTDDATQNKIAALEEQLVKMQELITLRDKQLAALLNQSQSNPAVQEQIKPPEVSAAQPPAQVVPTPLPAEPVQVVAPVQPATPAPAQPVPVQPPQPEANSLYFMSAGSGALFLTLLGWLWWRKRKVDQETNAESMFASSILVNTPEEDESLSVPIVENGIGYEKTAAGESSFLSEFTPSDFDSFDTDQGEIDPISEADVYLAYGRYQQAEELIRQAIKDQPNRDECKLKLLEIFYANENEADFEAYANELVAAGKRNEPGFWEQVIEMGREICPDSLLFSSGDKALAIDKDTAHKNSNDPDPLTSSPLMTSINGENTNHALEQSTPLTQEVENIAEQEQFKTGVVNGIGSFEESVSGNLANEKIASKGKVVDFDKSKDSPYVDEQKNNEDIDFDLSSFSMYTESPGEVDQEIITASSQKSMSSEAQAEELDFDLSSFSMGTKKPDETDNRFSVPSTRDMASKPREDNNMQEFELYQFDLKSDNVKTNQSDNVDFTSLEKDIENQQDANSSPDSTFDLSDELNSDFDFNFDLELPSSAANAQDTDQYDPFGVSDLTDMDELETKLDLAKAYVDMGDADAARDIAKEVLEQGTTEQKKIAQALLDELG
jgi:pilus assembly protein FimV